jgi:hypothetical protein
LQASHADAAGEERLKPIINRQKTADEQRKKLEQNFGPNGYLV